MSAPRWSAPSTRRSWNERIIPQIPVGRLGEPEEIARCVVFLASDEAGFLTGSTISPNGGYELRGAPGLNRRALLRVFRR
ncbi:MAG: SDR family oxidoreductase [Geminicoccaceae bacterium]